MKRHPSQFLPIPVKPLSPIVPRPGQSHSYEDNYENKPIAPVEPGKEETEEQRRQRFVIDKTYREGDKWCYHKWITDVYESAGFKRKDDVCIYCGRRINLW